MWRHWERLWALACVIFPDPSGCKQKTLLRHSHKNNRLLETQVVWEDWIFITLSVICWWAAPVSSIPPHRKLRHHTQAASPGQCVDTEAREQQ